MQAEENQGTYLEQIENFFGKVSIFIQSASLFDLESSKKCLKGHLMKFSNEPTQRQTAMLIDPGENVFCDQCNKAIYGVSEVGAFHCGDSTCDYDLCKECGSTS